LVVIEEDDEENEEAPNPLSEHCWKVCADEFYAIDPDSDDDMVEEIKDQKS